MTEEDYPYTAYVNKYFSIPLNDCELTHLMVFNFLLSFQLKQEDTCVYKPEKAAAFVKNVVNITAVSELDGRHFMLFWVMTRICLPALMLQKHTSFFSTVLPLCLF